MSQEQNCDLVPWASPSRGSSSQRALEFHRTASLYQCRDCLVTQSCPTLCDPMDSSTPGSSVHGILQVRILEWVAIPFSGGSSPPSDWTHVFCIGRQILYHWVNWEAPSLSSHPLYCEAFSLPLRFSLSWQSQRCAPWLPGSPSFQERRLRCSRGNLNLGQAGELRGNSYHPMISLKGVGPRCSELPWCLPVWVCWFHYYPLQYTLKAAYKALFASVTWNVVACTQITNAQFISVVSNSLWPRGPQDARLPCPSPTPWAYSLTSIELVMPSNHLILCHPLLLLPSIFPSIRVFSNESVLPIRWPKYWSFSFSICPSNECSGLISFRIDWLYLLAVQETLKNLLQCHSSKASVLQCSAFFMVQLSHPYMTIGKTIALTRQTFAGKVMSLLFNMLSSLVIAFLPRNKHLLISWLQLPSSVILETKKIKSFTVSIVSPTYLPWSDKSAHEFGWTPGVGDEQGSLACCSP